MLEVSMTPNLLGIKLSGDYDDLDVLYDAVWAVARTEDKDFNLIGTESERIMKTRLLALCYDIRHAYQGDRNIELVDSFIRPEAMQELKIAGLGKNVRYSVEILYPEAVFEIICLSYLVDIRKAELQKRVNYRPEYPESYRIVFDPVINLLRHYQSCVLGAIQVEATPNLYARICKQIGEEFFGISTMYTQWLDIINYDWWSMTKAQRKKGLGTVVRDIANYRNHDQYWSIKDEIDAFAEKHNCHYSDVRMPINDYYGDDLVW